MLGLAHEVTICLFPLLFGIGFGGINCGITLDSEHPKGKVEEDKADQDCG